ncbi:UDP-2,3-diacylglucosamine diphosphatase [Teredinibacter haidensis]|uniref:UDP-2,3-diacylglucosamine diphosphatase n=1 Tax=Teredinibacter haidensis TaxID=2731755 RepID=UPI00163D23AB|nr:UDP-2,3-diacylglucosamine diphosphatase [Teredinibacter haidensis]
MTDYFISDLHLEASRAPVAEAFFRFVEQTVIPEAPSNKLYILGDFFDAWVGDDDDNPLALNVQQKLLSYTQAGLSLYFQHGNRDFLVGAQFAQATGAQLLPEEHVIQLADRSALLMHGDSLCIDDEAYMQFRAQVRNPAWQQQILQLPLEQRRLMAQQLRAQSQSMNAMKAEDIMDVNAEEVTAALLRHDVITLIHGHTHRPAVHDIDVNGNKAQRLVLGDWGENAWFIKADSEGLTLHHFAI